MTSNLAPLPVTSPEKRSVLFTVCPFILVNELCERITFYGLSTNLVVYLREVMAVDAGGAAVQVMLFEGTCYLAPLFGAWVADSHWGRYTTILVFSCLYCVGTWLLAASALIPGLAPKPWEMPTLPQKAILYTALYIIAVGTGGIKPCVSALGADQFDDNDPRDRKEKESFWNAFYLVINIGSLFAVTVVVYIQETVGWGVGFTIPALCMLLAILVFASGSKRYTVVPPTQSALTRVFNVLRSAWRRRKTTRHLGLQGDAENTVPLLSNGSEPNLTDMHRVKSLAWLDGAIAEPGSLPDSGFTRSQVEEVKLVLRMIPVFITTILYWTIYIQMNTFFVEQGTQMDRRITSTFSIPAASLALFNTLSIIVLIPLYDRGLVPLLRRMGKRITLLQRIGWGLLVAVFAMLAAAAVEWYRLQLFSEGKVLPSDNIGSMLAHHRLETVDMSVFWQVPQYLLIGLSEVLTSIGQLEFFYDQAPDVMRSCSMALQLLSVCIGSYLSGALVWATGVLTSWNGGPGWLAKDLNYGRLDLFFCFMAGLMVFGLLTFLAVAMRYEYKQVDHTRTARPPVRPTRGPRAPMQVARRGRTMPVAAMPGASADGRADMERYSRSVTFAPPSPALPPPLR